MYDEREKVSKYTETKYEIIRKVAKFKCLGEVIELSAIEKELNSIG